MESNVIEKEISVTGVEITSDVKVLDGREMYKGDPGYTPQKGVDYFDGRTPVKGTDYFTETEKAEMVSEVKAQLITEQWTFTLTDGTTVTKDVVTE